MIRPQVSGFSTCRGSVRTFVVLDRSRIWVLRVRAPPFLAGEIERLPSNASLLGPFSLRISFGSPSWRPSSSATSKIRADRIELAYSGRSVAVAACLTGDTQRGTSDTLRVGRVL